MQTESTASACESGVRIVSDLDGGLAISSGGLAGDSALGIGGGTRQSGRVVIVGRLGFADPFEFAPGEWVEDVVGREVGVILWVVLPAAGMIGEFDVGDVLEGVGALSACSGDGAMGSR